MIRYGLQQEQGFKLVMTPELRQAITILQYSSADLISFLHEQANNNPVIDLPEFNMSIGSIKEEAERFSQKDQGDLLEHYRGGEKYPSVQRANPVTFLDFVPNPNDTLFEHLNRQLGLVCGLTNSQRMVARYLIGNLNEMGYLELDVPTVASLLDVPIAEIEDMLLVIQSFDPPGIASYSLEECLLLQLQLAGMDDECIVRMVSNHLADLANNRIQKIADALEIGRQEVIQMADRIRKLNPCPGAAFAHKEQQYIIADITVEKANGEYLVLINDISAPRVEINPFYRQMMQDLPNSETKRFIHEKMNTAKWLINSLKQRRLTLLRVAKAIVEKQQDFFEHGVYFLKPITQKEIADKTGLHESTVSRAVSNKFIQTPRGLFELKFFFTSSLTSADGDAASSESAKKRIKNLIDDEDKQKPLSDQAITTLLGKEGLHLSRRTVAKYREELRYLSSAKRKKFEV
ncbi:RNA polymerase factor sigma-54 [Paenibacillus peoriae]|uniref:RNA polymerase factor sigma-54 n=1 Tax=Paenibacillus TaxID=44249 RepID=UPI0030F7A6FD